MIPDTNPSMPSTVLSPHIQAIYAGVDWLGLTLRREAENWAIWVDECRQTIEAIASEGETLEPWGMEGYRGQRAGGSFWGMRDDGAYCRLTGHHAHHHFDRVYRPDCNCSRIDLQVTVRLREMDNTIGQLHEAESLSANELLPEKRRRKIWHISGNDGGYTLYIGSLHSPRHGYVYNKEVESGQAKYSRCWRYEVRYKNDHATIVALGVWSALELRVAGIARTVADFFIDRGCILPWYSELGPELLPIEREVPSDADRKLNWLKTQVRPAVRWLRENGFALEAGEALGMECEAPMLNRADGRLIWRFPDE